MLYIDLVQLNPLHGVECPAVIAQAQRPSVFEMHDANLQEVAPVFGEAVFHDVAAQLLDEQRHVVTRLAVGALVLAELRRVRRGTT